MAGVYVHIPFCKQLCSYCDFYFTMSLTLKSEMMRAIENEILLRKDFFNGEIPDTIYIGGGTPSLCSIDELQSLTETVKKTFEMNDISEFTVEVNPEDLSEEYLKGLLEIGVNRLSVGVQSFIDRDLKFMNRRHNAQTAIDKIRQAQKVGFSNISIDLIYGVPVMSLAEWEQNIKQTISLNPTHISAYHLGIEEKTVLGKKLKRGEITAIDDKESVAQYELLTKITRDNGFEHYEISNFAKSDYRGVHNSRYWDLSPYIGLGPSAHSFIGNTRSWNVANNKKYIESLKQNILPQENEILTETDKFNESVMLGLRTSDGVSLNKIRETFGKNALDNLLEASKKHILNNEIIIASDKIIINENCLLLSNAIISSLFRV